MSQFIEDRHIKSLYHAVKKNPHGLKRRKHFRFRDKGMKGKGCEERMQGLFTLRRMVASRRVFGEEGNVLPSTFSLNTGMAMLPETTAASAGIQEKRMAVQDPGKASHLSIPVFLCSYSDLLRYQKEMPGAGKNSTGPCLWTF
jgi:hypothetical protein